MKASILKGECLDALQANMASVEGLAFLREGGAVRPMSMTALRKAIFHAVQEMELFGGYMTNKEAAAALGVTPARITGLVRQGRLRSSDHFKGCYSAKDIAAYAASDRRPGRKAATAAHPELFPR